jgi:hypothetical protein
MFKQGDKYIHFTKYGGVNKGEVEWYGPTMNYDYENEVVYVSYYIKSTVGHIISIDGSDGRVYKINETMDPEMLKKLKSSVGVLDVLKNRKETKVERTKEMIKDDKFRNEDGTIEPLSESLIKKINKQIDERSL